MENKAFFTVLIVLIVICLILTLAHFFYIIYAYGHCSIIYFIGKELW